VWVFVTDNDTKTSDGYATTLVDPPSITDVDPSTVLDGTVGVEITGTDFLSAQGTGKVELGDNSDYASADLETQTVTNWSGTSILFNVSQGTLSTGTVYVFVTTDNDHTSAGSAMTLTTGPELTSVTPSQFINGDTGIDVAGSSFGATQGTGKVELANSNNYSQATKVTQTITGWGDTAIEFTAVFGPLSSGTNYVFVTNDSGITSAAYGVTLLEPPTVSGVNPDSFTDATAGIVISGVYFGSSQGTGKVELGDAGTYAGSTKVAQTVTNWGDTSVTFTSVQGAHSPGSVWVYLTNDSGYTSSGYEVTLNSPPAAGTVTISATQTTASDTIDPIDMDHSFLLMRSTGDSGATSSQNHQATGYISSSTQVSFERAGTTDDCYIGYQVVQAENEEFEVIYRGSITIDVANTTGDQDIGVEIDQTRSFIVSNSRIGGAGGTCNVNKGFATVHFVDNDTVRATRATSGTYSTVVRFEVIQWHEDSGVVVQTDEYSGSIGPTEVTDSITTAVTKNKTWLYATARHTSNGLHQTAVKT